MAEESDEPEDPEALDDDIDSIVVGPAGFDDPETEWHISGLSEETPDLSALGDDEFVLLRPGEEPEVTDVLPKPKHLAAGLAFSRDRLVVCSGRLHRTISTSPEVQGDESAPLGHGLTVVFIQHRAEGNRMRPRRYVVVTSEENDLLAWLDYSDMWAFDAGALRALTEGCGLEFSLERFTLEPEFEAAHPTWVG